jgi:CcdB protein
LKFAVQQFDIVENANPVTRSRYPFVVVLQHNRVATAATVIVTPLTAPNSMLAASRLHPSINVGSRCYLLLSWRRLIGAHFGRVVGSAESERYAVIAAIDLCFTGL